MDHDSKVFCKMLAWFIQRSTKRWKFQLQVGQKPAIELCGGPECFRR
uniref:Uncharacterized protein n=1 Tax=Arundo donax TaxID=35708 RepID=A0A0A9CC12_ARUDO